MTTSDHMTLQEYERVHKYVLKNASQYFAVRQGRFFFQTELSPTLAWQIFGINELIMQRIKIAIMNHMEKEHGRRNTH